MKSARIRLALPLLCCLFLAACGSSDKAAIAKVLNARDHAISSRDVGGYSRLIATDYHDNGHSKVDIVAQVINLFDHFDEVKMHSFDRQIRLIDKNHAECRQSYRLAVRSGKHWQKMVEREQLSFVRTPVGWEISGGL